MDLILYTENNENHLLTSAMADIDINILAEKDVPAGIPYLIIDKANLPTESIETWQVDYSSSTGKGLTQAEFYAKYPQYIGWAVK